MSAAAQADPSSPESPASSTMAMVASRTRLRLSDEQRTLATATCFLTMYSMPATLR
jgi:hypothetical protein